MRHGLRSGAEWAVDTVMTALISGMAFVLLLAMAGCVGWRAPVFVYQRGPETNYNQERSGNMSRSTTAEQQVAETTAEQQQQSNQTDAAMASAVDETKQVGLKQGQAQDVTKATGRDTAGATSGSPTQSPTGQEGGDAAAIGQTPTAGGGGGGQGGTGAASTGGTTTETQPADPPADPVDANYEAVATAVQGTGAGAGSATWDGGGIAGTYVGGFVPSDGKPGWVYRFTNAAQTVAVLLSPAMADELKAESAAAATAETTK